MQIIIAVILFPLALFVFPFEEFSPWIQADTLFICIVSIATSLAYVLPQIFNPIQKFSSRQYLHSSTIIVSLIALIGIFIAFIAPIIPLPNNNSNIVHILSNKDLWSDNNFLERVITQPRIVISSILLPTAAFISILICIVSKLISQSRERRAMEQRLKEMREGAELALYKAQINPHFMFNALNSLYALVLSKSDAAEDAFIKFTSIIKYMYRNADKEFIPINEELEYISQFIDLQRLRLNQNTNVQFSHSIENLNTPIPPMLLITFIENAFKYGIIPSQDNSININISENNNNITFSTFNHINQNKKSENGIGITNCRKRLELLYPNRHTLDITSNNLTFTVKLTLTHEQRS